MSSSTANEIPQLSQQSQQPTADRERRPSTFLSLAPSMSDSYPRTQKTKDIKVPALTADALTQATKEGEVSPVVVAKQHRTSSLSSDGSKTGLRFLKLGPVHWGEHQGEGQADWHEVAVE